MNLDPFFLDTKDAGFISDPYPVYRTLRNCSPAYYSERYNAWFLTKYTDVKNVLGDSSLFGFPVPVEGVKSLNPTWSEIADNAIGFEGYLSLKNKTLESQSLWISNRNAEDHSRIKKAFSPPFLSGKLKLSEEGVRKKLDDILNNIEGKSQIDIIKDISIPLTSRVFLDLLGVGYEYSDWIQEHSLKLSMLFFLDITKREKEEGVSSLINFMEFFRKETKEQAGGDANKLIALLLEGKCLGRISMDEVLANLSFFILAGVQSTIYFIGNLFYCLQQYPDQFALIKKMPSLIEKACEETLRFETANSFSVRYALEDTEISGQKIKASQKLVLLVGAANRDESVFKNAEEFDVLRESNSHLAFGYGTRYCIGSYLSRMEAKVTLEVMLERFPMLSFEQNQVLDWYDNFRVRGLNSLKVNLL